MSLLADALLPHVVKGVTSIEGRIDGTLFADIITSPKAAYALAFDNATRAVRLDFGYPDPIAYAVASDCSRLSISAIQSATTAHQVFSNKIDFPWALVKLYYASFYAGHSICRLLGSGCVFLGKAHTKRIVDFGTATGNAPTFPIDAGLYRCTINTSSDQMEWLKLSGAAGGSHETFWTEFLSIVGKTGVAVLSGPLPQIDAQSVFAKLAELESCFKRNGGPAWLARMRNELQYRHAYEAWFRCGIASRDRLALAKLAGQWKSDPMTIDLSDAGRGDLGEFVTACSFVISTCHALLLRIADISTRRVRSFLHYGPFALINEMAG